MFLFQFICKVRHRDFFVLLDCDLSGCHSSMEIENIVTIHIRTYQIRSIQDVLLVRLLFYDEYVHKAKLDSSSFRQLHPFLSQVWSKKSTFSDICLFYAAWHDLSSGGKHADWSSWGL